MRTRQQVARPRDHAQSVELILAVDVAVEFAQRVRILGRALGRTLRFEAQPDDEAEAEMRASMPPEYVKAFLRFNVDGTLDESTVLPTVSEVTGTPPRTFEQWATAHKEELR